MSFPKFKINEEVILNSKSLPKYNGEYYIRDFCGKTDEKGDIIYRGITYNLSPFVFAYDIGLEKLLAAESALRKKHKGSEFNFESLMENLKKEQQKA